MERKQKVDAREAELDQVVPILDVDRLKTLGPKLKVSDITLQINWHRRHDSNRGIPSKTLIAQKKDDKLIQLIIAVERYNKNPATSTALVFGVPTTAAMDWEEIEDQMDEDMEC